MTITWPAIVRLTAAGAVAVGLLLGMSSAQAGMMSSLSADASLHRMSNGEIAFDNGAGPPRLDVINPNGSGLRPLTRSCTTTTTNCVFRAIKWSPDGRKLAFLRGNAGGARTPAHLSLFVINADGSREKWLARCDPSGCGAFGGSRLSWSPNGSRILFSRGGSLTVVNTRTSRLRRITTCTGLHPGSAGKKGCSDSDPAWSPDGSRTLFSRWLFSQNASELIVMHPDGSGLRRITRPQTNGTNDSVWSPDGHSIAFDSSDRSGDRIHEVRADGSHLSTLVSGPPGSGPGVPSWSPDATHIVFFKTPRVPRAGPGHPPAFKPEVWVMTANGTRQTRLYHSLCCIGDWGRPIWSPDGMHIAFSVTVLSRDERSLRAPKSGLFTMGADGRHLRRLVAADANELAWQPNP